MSKTKKALALVDKGQTPYAVAKLLGMSTTTIYKAMKARNRPKCPTCHQPLPRG